MTDDAATLAQGPRPHIGPRKKARLDYEEAFENGYQARKAEVEQAEADLTTALRHIAALLDPNLSGLTERSQDHQRSVYAEARAFLRRHDAQPGGGG